MDQLNLFLKTETDNSPVIKPIISGSLTKGTVNIIDLFAGIGGFHYGIASAYSTMRMKVNSSIVSEIEESCVQVYKKNFKCDVQGDINKIAYKDYKNQEIDIISAGFPCQPFSNSGKKLGLDDPRGQFYYTIEGFIKHFKPKSFILENVPGIRYNGGGKFRSELGIGNPEIGHTMKFLEENLTRLKQYHIKWVELDSSIFGSPQVRKRVYVIGVHKDFCNSLELDFPKFKLNSFISIAEGKKIPELELNTTQEQNLRSFMLKSPSFQNGMRRVGNAYLCKGGNVGQGYHAYGLVPTLTKVWARFLPIYFPHEKENLPELNSRKFSPNSYYGKGYFRKASVAEVFALQGFPKNFIPHENKPLAYQHAGNSVNAKVVRELVKLILRHIY